MTIRREKRVASKKTFRSGSLCVQGGPTTIGVHFRPETPINGKPFGQECYQFFYGRRSVAAAECAPLGRYLRKSAITVRAAIGYPGQWTFFAESVNCCTRLPHFLENRDAFPGGIVETVVDRSAVLFATWRPTPGWRGEVFTKIVASPSCSADPQDDGKSPAGTTQPRCRARQNHPFVPQDIMKLAGD